MLSAVGERVALQRPYTHGTFQQKLTEFEELIKELTLQDVEATPEERRQLITENLRYDQFCDSIKALFGPEIKNADLKSIYRKISTNPDAKVDWSELFGYFQGETDETETNISEDISIFMVSRRIRIGEAAGDRKRRDIVQSIRHVPSLDGYLTVSQKGAISIWNSKLRLQTCSELNETSWVTGCDYLPGIRRVAASTERSICIWDNRAKGKNQTLFSIKPFEHSPQCMTWIPDSTNAHEDTILFGDDQGYINYLTVAAKDLTMKNSRGERKTSQNINVDPTKMTYPVIRRKIHDDWVLKIKYFPELRCFASCSPGEKISFVLEEVPRIKDTGEVRGVGVSKGVNAFDYSVRANVIATGGVDKVIRVWHPHIFSRPTGKLVGHLFTIIDIGINEKDQHIISLSTARVFRVWDIHTLTCLQVFTDNEDRPGEKRIYSMFFDNKHDRLLTGSSVLDAWPLTRSVQDTMQVPHTHDRPVVLACLNLVLQNLITVCSESELKVWEYEGGRLLYQNTEPHGPGVELTAIVLNKAGYRLATGAIDGSVKVWDTGSGQVIKHKEYKGIEEDVAINSLHFCDVEDQRCILLSGWGNKLKLLLDSNENNDLQVLRDFTDVLNWTAPSTPAPVEMTSDYTFSKGKPPLPDIGGGNAQVTNMYKKECILKTHEISSCTSYDPSNKLITGCTNGNIIFWDINKSIVEKVIPLPEAAPGSAESHSNTRSKSGHERRVNHLQVVVHQTRRIDPDFIKKLTKGRNIKEEDLDAETLIETLQSKLMSQATSQATSQNQSRTHSVNGLNMDGLRGKTAENFLDELTAKIEGLDSSTKEQQHATHTKEAQGDTKDTVVEKTDDATGEDEAKSTAGDEEVNLDDIDPDQFVIVQQFDPVLISCHQDSVIRFWDLEGALLHEVSAVTPRQGAAVTSLCHDRDCNTLITGDSKGYITMWDVGKFLEAPYTEDEELIKQTICWRGHLSKISALTYVDSTGSIVSSSTDGSVRVWWGNRGRFVGFFGQHRPFHFPHDEESAGPPILPYDINEAPVAPVKTKTDPQKIAIKNVKYEYPLIFDSHRWKPLRRSAHFASKESPREPNDAKFFEALIKPRAYNDHLEFNKNGSMKEGAVFGALPIYTVDSISKPKTPALGFPVSGEEDNSFLYGGRKPAKPSKQTEKKKRKSVGTGLTSILKHTETSQTK
ncbi:unnamed protein product [Owenia fusiformis]|uniref:Uncharacterized protein n=1 Tax=Owenia fusiformis TaxID=6347 RepID=A0A8J1XXF5_OWEFU|nr:unnamed protein product [Owenia fusiformis]